MPIARFHIEGRVQGVGFRAATRAAAMRIGLVGYAMNRADGSVEVLACGSEAALAELHDWLTIGPALAQVDRVCVSEAPDAVVSNANFEIHRGRDS
ncbi:MAG: acylphosphatase [Lysobacterales bacterium CG02_land_8_20_14_3_00_62_12]|nr:MAG: acylphosphatase [Xanthomonadales bacterium CG02_land_8_20_14_3_00_62_12]